MPNEQHLPVAREVAKAGKHVYTEKPIASTLEEGLEIAALTEQYEVTVTVGHSARLLGGPGLGRREILENAGFRGFAWLDRVEHDVELRGLQFVPAAAGEVKQKPYRRKAHATDVIRQVPR